LTLNSDTDSGYDENALSTASLTSSIYEYEHENGRTYHKTGKYVMPNDEGEQQRMDSKSGRLGSFQIADIGKPVASVLTLAQYITTVCASP